MPGAIERLQKELENLRRYPVEGCYATPKDDGMYNWEAVVVGPRNTPYADGLFALDFTFPRSYPFTPPVVTFKTKIYHCNVGKNGYVCMDILGAQWSPALSLSSLLLSIQSFLNDPNPEEPFEEEIALQYKINRKEHDRMAKLWTEEYAG